MLELMQYITKCKDTFKINSFKRTHLLIHEFSQYWSLTVLMLFIFQLWLGPLSWAPFEEADVDRWKSNGHSIRKHQQCLRWITNASIAFCLPLQSNSQVVHGYNLSYLLIGSLAVPCHQLLLFYTRTLTFVWMIWATSIGMHSESASWVELIRLKTL